MDRREEFFASRRVVFFVHIKGWSPNAVDFWRGPYQTVSSAQAQATRMTRKQDGTALGDWFSKIYRLDSDSDTLVEVK